MPQTGLPSTDAENSECPAPAPCEMGSITTVMTLLTAGQKLFFIQHQVKVWSCGYGNLRPGLGLRGRELLGGVGKTMMQSGGTFGTFMAIGMGIRC
ncbi:reactive oxygen species modulator 1 isoform X1 [Carcharodon carcharias]|uniref:reactive oxygen species modulator 1 isoform X1 n=1 Tax=Carcharodon carcharias TaxID=13397 RepID=UPI001B7DA825|nr:reactive oxygen species modulator 1 isoform X1 [Carcharodon carcharias]